MKRLAILLLPVLLAACDPAPIRDANDELTLHFINQEIYPAVVCNNLKFEEEWYIGCYGASLDNPKGGTISVFHVVLADVSDTKYAIFTVNGPAQRIAGNRYPRDPYIHFVPDPLDQFR